MKRLLVMAVLVVTALGFSVTTGVAASGGGTVVHSVAHYTVSYTDPVYGPVTCTGVHQTGKNIPGTAITGPGPSGPYIPASGTGGQDSFTCTSTTGLPLMQVTPGESISFYCSGCGWNSDFVPLNGEAATSFTGTVSSDGFSYTAVATYPYTP
jgi:hypothetical protein